MKRKILSILLALCLALTLLPTAAFAEGSEEELPVCTCETACAVESLNADCPVCGAEGASAESCAKYIKPADDVPTQSESEPVVLNGEGETENVTWKDIGQGDTELLKTSGNYKLTENIDNLNALDIGNFYNAEITLDLNGFTLTGADNSYYTLWINQTSTLILKDSVGGGKVVSPNGTAVYVGAQSTFTIEAGEISGGVVVGDGLLNATTTFKMDGGIVTGSVTTSGKVTMTLTDGTVDGIYLGNNSTLYANGGTVTGPSMLYGRVLRSENATGTTVFNGVVVNPSGQEIPGTLNGGTVIGSGSLGSPYLISTAAGLKWFRDYVNSATDSSPDRYGLSATLTADIDLDGEAWTPIAPKTVTYKGTTCGYFGTFDGGGHTISGLNANATVSGLFGYTKNAAIKNLTVAGSVGGGSCLTAGGGIVGYAVGGTIENCGNLCGVAVPGSSPGGGIVGFASDLTIIGCYNAGLVHKGDGSRGGGIVGVGTKVKIYDCYNVGKVEGFSGRRGGIVGEASGPVFVYNCYNVGNVIEAGGTGDANKTVCGIVGGGDGPVQIQNCYYLEGTKADAGATAKTAAEFADGTVLALLINGRTDSPWDSTCKYVTAAGKTLPVFKGQGNAHEHSGAWTSNGDGTHSRTCACGVTETAKCSGGTATRTARAVCQVCGQPYGQLASGGGIRRQPTGGSGAANTSNTTKTVKSGNTGDMGVMLYAGMALLSLTGGAWVVGKKRK